MTSLSLRLTTPYLSSQSAIVTASIPSGPAAPDNFLATVSTTKAVTFTSMKAGTDGNVCSASNCGSTGSGCFDLSTSDTNSPDFEQMLSGESKPPFSQP
eukprot:3595319-Ditylum_brightwellii.AAC.1